MRFVIGTMAMAAVLVGAGAIRTAFFKADDSVKGAHASGDAPRAPATMAAPSPVEQKTALPLPSPGIEQHEPPANTVAPASSSEPPPAATENTAAAAPLASGVRLAVTRTSPDSTQTKAADASKARTAQRVEEAKHVQRPPRSPVVPRRPHTEAASHAPVSPQLPGSGAIVRQSPF
jgi:hypothetical protein